MKIKASLNNLRIAPRKVRLVAGLVRGLSIDEAKNQLQFLSKHAAKPILKLLVSAQHNAENNFGIEKNNLFIKEILVNEGRVLKRWLPRAFGRVSPILKRTSHINVVLEELDPKKAKKATAQTVKQPMEIIKESAKVKEADKSGQDKETRVKSIIGKEAKGKTARPSFKNVGKFFRRKSI